MTLSSRSRIAAFAAALCVLVAIGATAAARTGTDQSRLILRLPDLGPGYLNLALREEQGDEVLCEALTDPEDTPPKLLRFVLRYHPRGCIGGYTRYFEIPGRVPGPMLVGTGAMALQSDPAADAAWSVLPILLGRLLSDRVPREVSTSARIGKATRLFHSDDLSRAYRVVGRKASILVWRSGNTLAAIMVFGHSFAAVDAAAAELAPSQQAHIAKPTRYTAEERFDGDVPLDDPALELPVYWLGRNFKPGHGLPSNRFFDGYAPKPHQRTGESEIGLEEAPGAVVRLRYSNFPIDSWSDATWPLYLRAKVSRVLTAWRCTQTRTVALPSGSATIYGGYRDNPRRCPKRAPDAFTAWVEVPGMHLVVNSPWCANCILHTPYDSFAGMEAIVRGLELRPKPVY